MSTATARHPGDLTPTSSTPATPSRRTGRLRWLAPVAGLVALSGTMFLPWLVSLSLAGAAVAIGVGVLGFAVAARGPGVGHGVAGLVTALVAFGVAVSSALVPNLGVALLGADSRDGGGGLPLPSPPPTEPAGQQEVVFLPPVGIQASATAPDSQDAGGDTVTFDAGNAVDGDDTTAWRVPGDGVGDYLVLTFDRLVHVEEIAMIPGYAKVDSVDGTDRFAQNRRVRSAQFELSGGQALTIAYADQPVLQYAAIGLETTEVTMRISASTPAQRDFTAVSELQVYGWIVE